MLDCPCGKRHYPREWAARRALRAIQERGHLFRQGMGRLGVYRCPLCRMWCLGTSHARRRR